MGLPTVHSKLPDIPTTIFTVMSVMAAENNAVNLGQGYPDYQMSEQLIGLVDEAMSSGANQYTHTNGFPALREVIAEKVSFLYQTIIDPVTQITITPGGTYAIYNAITTVLQAGDEAIVFEPAYDSYVPNVVINGAIPIIIELNAPNYKIDWSEVRSKITPKTRLIILNTPHNPTGSILDAEDIKQLREIVQDSNIFILSDEVYEHLVFDGRTHHSILRYPDLLERSFVCFSFGKVYHCTGWKLGYCISSPSLMHEFRKVHQFNCFSCHTPSQVALADYLKQRSTYVDLGPWMQRKKDLFQQLMQSTRFRPLPSYGSYFQLYSYDRISDEPDKEFAIRITKEFGVAGIPLSAFFHSGKDDRLIRFCFAKKEETLERAVEKLVKV